MVRAAGLYPAGSRFESWLPYHPDALSARRSPSEPTPSAVVDARSGARGSVRRSRRCRSAFRIRDGGSDVSQAGICSWVITAQLGVRSIVGVARDDAPE